MRSEIVKITPELAAKWIGKNIESNRKLRKRIVERYTRDMLNGEWKITHQGIAFDSTGRLIDGHHRLNAIVAANIAIDCLVMFDVPAKAFDHVDIGFCRTAEDILKSDGHGWITREFMAMARMIDGSNNMSDISKDASPFEIRDLVIKYQDSIEFVRSRIERRVNGVTIAPVLAAIATAFYSEADKIRLGQFIVSLVTGIVKDPATDGVVVQLRDWLKSGTTKSQNRMTRNEAFLKTQRVIKAFMRKERLAKLYTPDQPIYRIEK